ncbi:DUF4837 family protein [candidate division WOR-3 bacterium]|nr:DUF4837 family protein [candidate division WOR-3 bacterium]
MIKKLLLYLSVLGILIVSNCDGLSLPHSAGRRDDIIIIVEEEFNTDSLRKVLERVEYYPSREEVYRVREFPPALFNQYQYWRNLIVIGTYEDDYIDELLSDEAKSSLSTGGGILSEEDLWVRFQSVVIITGRGREETQMMINQYAGVIYQIFRDRERKRYEKILYLDGFEEIKAKEMERLFGASYKIPFGYHISVEGNQFITYIRKSPDRLVTLIYSNKPIRDPIKFRDSLFTLHFEGDSVYIPMIVIDTVEFKNETSLRIQGVWQNNKKVMGGPFISYVFEKDGIWYFLDGHVFAPGKKKWVYLEEVDIILSTFKKVF